MKSRTTLFLIAPALLAACATVPPPGEDIATIRAHRLKPMSEREIRRRFIGWYLEPVKDPQVLYASPHGEHYKPNGRFLLILHRVTRSGSFEVKGSRLCTTLGGVPDQPTCRTIYQSPSGAIFMPLLLRSGTNLIEVEAK